MSGITHHPRSLLVTGGAGFIGCNFVRHILAHHPDLSIVNLDSLTYAGHPASLRDIESDHADRYTFVHGDIRNDDTVRQVFAQHSIDTVVHFAAESHVDRSIDGPLAFVDTNVRGTVVLLEASREFWRSSSDVRFHHVSTDEVYGSLGATGLFHEDSVYDPSSPYAASKAAADHMVRAWHRTYDFPMTISNCSNNYGPYQFPEKLIPLLIANGISGQPLPVYGDGGNVRDWLYVTDHCEALDTILRSGQNGQTYNVGGRNERRNIEVVELLCDLLDELRPRSGGGCHRDLITHVTDRPGHDRRYAIDPTRIEQDLGWHPRHSFDEGLRDTVRWYLENQDWCEEVTRDRYDGSRLGLG
jgi:dTDP-glucose 4,6-dehydratase